MHYCCRRRRALLLRTTMPLHTSSWHNHACLYYALPCYSVSRWTDAILILQPLATLYCCICLGAVAGGKTAHAGTHLGCDAAARSSGAMQPEWLLTASDEQVLGCTSTSTMLYQVVPTVPCSTAKRRAWGICYAASSIHRTTHAHACMGTVDGPNTQDRAYLVVGTKATVCIGSKVRTHASGLLLPPCAPPPLPVGRH